MISLDVIELEDLEAMITECDRSDMDVSLLVLKGPDQVLHEAEGMIASDDVSGEELDPRLVHTARQEEMKYFRSMGV